MVTNWTEVAALKGHLTVLMDKLGTFKLRTHNDNRLTPDAKVSSMGKISMVGVEVQVTLKEATVTSFLGGHDSDSTMMLDNSSLDPFAPLVRGPATSRHPT